ncbi:hypothetical protein BDV93DRAFT_552715 [Ceratobasidium sp. AG-I]|nr:hypothetical protein BDV93DRAFT_552715 [Ceratobasidium sp. AG-I]
MTSTPIPDISQADSTSLAQVDLLILGAGWLWYFLRPVLDSRGLTYGATTRTGHVPGTIAWTLGVDSVEVLPKARTVVVTFPVLEWELLDGFMQAYERGRECRWVLLGSTRGWQTGGDGQDSSVITRHTPLPPDAPARSLVEQAFLEKYSARATVLNLVGLHGIPESQEGKPRVVPNFLRRVAPSKEALRAKGSLHLVHGRDAARAVVTVHECAGEAAGRWIVSDGLVRDWWAVALELGDEQVRGWVLQLMREHGVRVLPRAVGSAGLGRVVDGAEFWIALGGGPERVGMSV